MVTKKVEDLKKKKKKKKQNDASETPKKNPMDSGTDPESLKVHKRMNLYKEHMDDNGKPYYSSVDDPKEVVWVLPKDGEVVKTTNDF